MITKEEFLKALEVVNNYKIQVSEQFEEMKKDLDKKEFSHLAITKNTPINKTGLSVRALNALRANLCEIESITELKWDMITVGNFEGLKKSDLYRFINVGKKSINEIEKVFFEAGMVLVN